MSTRYSNTMVGIAVACIVTGLVLVIWPAASRNIICYILGAAALLYGIYRIAAYFLHYDSAQEMRYGVAIGVGCALLGIFLLFKAQVVSNILGMIIGVAVIIDSVLRIQVAFDIRRMRGSQWLPLMAAAVGVLLIGTLLLFNPFSAIQVATVVAGVALIIDGALTIWGTLRAAKILNGGGAGSRVR